MRDKLVLSLEEILHNDYYGNCSVANRSIVVSLKGLGAKMNLIGCEMPVVKLL
jgi:hypothetical protein